MPWTADFKNEPFLQKWFLMLRGQHSNNIVSVESIHRTGTSEILYKFKLTMSKLDSIRPGLFEGFCRTQDHLGVITGVSRWQEMLRSLHNEWLRGSSPKSHSQGRNDMHILLQNRGRPRVLSEEQERVFCKEIKNHTNALHRYPRGLNVVWIICSLVIKMDQHTPNHPCRVCSDS